MATVNIYNNPNSPMVGRVQSYVRGNVALLEASAYVPSINIFMSCGMHETMESARAAILEFHLAL